MVLLKFKFISFIYRDPSLHFPSVNFKTKGCKDGRMPNGFILIKLCLFQSIFH